MFKQLYRFQIQKELSPGVFSAVDEATESTVQLIEVPLDPPHRDRQMVELRRIAAERGCEDFSVNSNFYLVATPATRVGDLRQTLATRGFRLPAPAVPPPPLPPPIPPPRPLPLPTHPSRPTLWYWIAGIAFVLMIVIALVADWGGKAPSPNSSQASYPSLTPAPQQSQSLKELNQGAAEFNAKHYKSARASFNASCNAGNPNACGYLALLYAKGLGGPLDLDRARQLYRGSCEQGDTHSCMSLGYIYRSGNQSGESVAFFKKACAGGMPEGCAQAQRVK